MWTHSWKLKPDCLTSLVVRGLHWEGGKPMNATTGAEKLLSMLFYLIRLIVSCSKPCGQWVQIKAKHCWALTRAIKVSKNRNYFMNMSIQVCHAAIGEGWNEKVGNFLKGINTNISLGLNGSSMHIWSYGTFYFLFWSYGIMEICFFQKMFRLATLICSLMGYKNMSALL